MKERRGAQLNPSRIISLRFQDCEYLPFLLIFLFRSSVLALQLLSAEPDARFTSSCCWSLLQCLPCCCRATFPAPKPFFPAANRCFPLLSAVPAAVYHHQLLYQLHIAVFAVVQLFFLLSVVAISYKPKRKPSLLSYIAISQPKMNLSRQI